MIDGVTSNVCGKAAAAHLRENLDIALETPASLCTESSGMKAKGPNYQVLMSTYWLLEIAT